MNSTIHALSRRRTSAFALVATLIIVAVLAVVVVGFLASMIGERQTADAYTSKTRAEEAAQAGVESAIGELEEVFRDYPDSCTAWDLQQSTNVNVPANVAANNEGTTLYLRAVPQTLPSGTVVPNPNPSNSTLASDVNGNGPNNPGRETFALPLVSGVPGGYPQLVTNKANILPTCDLSVTNPASQTYTDLNVRRFGPNAAYPYGDVQGAIGSPPGWGASTAPPIPSPSPVPSPTPVPNPQAPKPARAPWVTITDNNGYVSGRYAFWIEDESFRLNANYAGGVAQGEPTPSPAPLRIDNGPDPKTGKFPANTITLQPYALQPSDASLAGGLAVFDSTNLADATTVINARAIYPGVFFPDPLAFVHSPTSASGASTFSTASLDAMRYLLTTQSGTLNLTRHGTQRLNLNTTVATVSPTTATNIQQIQHQVDQLVQTLEFHLPNLGQRFYRLSAGTDSTTLNATQVPTLAPGANVGNPQTIYFYKVAANLRDFIDAGCQPTMIKAPGTVEPVQTPTAPSATGDGANPIWAQGKKAAPFLQETVVRYQPTVDPVKKIYTLAVDYYLEFWNMSDRDVSATTDLNNAFVRVSDQQTWGGNATMTPLDTAGSQPPRPRAPESDYNIDLTGKVGPVYLNGVVQPGGVVFKAGVATVITTDPDYAKYVMGSPPTASYVSRTGPSNPLSTYYCTGLTGGYSGASMRTFTGPFPPTSTDKGIAPVFRDPPQLDNETEITLANPYGWIDSLPWAVPEAYGPVNTSSTSGPNTDYAYGGSLHGNSAISESGDPRTNNEQMFLTHYVSGGTADQSRYFNGDHTLGYPNCNDSYVLPDGNSYPWSDYYKFPGIVGSYGAIMSNPDQTTAPAVIANSALSSIGQLGDVFDPARIALNPTQSDAQNSRGGGRTFKIGQRDDRTTYNPTGNPSVNSTATNSLNNVPASQSWASWRLTDVFSAGPVVAGTPYGATQEPLELPGRLNINGMLRDNGAAFRALLTGFVFQPATGTYGAATTPEPLFHTPPAFAGATLDTTDNNAGLAKLVAQITTRLTNAPSVNNSLSTNIPWGPFFERGELGELDVNNTSIFGKNVTSTFLTSTGLNGVDMNRTFDHGREELFRRLAEMICTRGDTFTVYVVGQSLQPLPGTTPMPSPTPATPTAATFKITGTHRMRVTFRLVPKQVLNGVVSDFHPAYSINNGTVSGNDFDPTNSNATSTASVPYRFSKPDHYDVQILAANAM